jgi:hypothetical protein
MLALLVVVVGRANAVLLPSDVEGQLETWLGQGDLTFTNVFEKQDGDTSVDFYEAVRLTGPTFTLFEATLQSGYRAVLGGYNPQAWDPFLREHRLTPADADRTAFIFNLTETVIERQNLSSSFGGIDCTPDLPAGDCGQFQTYNHALFGPIFGLDDLLVDRFLNAGWETSCSCLSAFGATNEGLLPGHEFPIQRFTVGALETYTFMRNTTSVPEPASLLLLLTGVTGLVATRKRLKQARP